MKFSGNVKAMPFNFISYVLPTFFVVPFKVSKF